MEEKDLEKEIQAKGLTAPRITPAECGGENLAAARVLFEAKTA